MSNPSLAASQAHAPPLCGGQWLCERPSSMEIFMPTDGRERGKPLHACSEPQVQEGSAQKQLTKDGLTSVTKLPQDCAAYIFDRGSNAPSQCSYATMVAGKLTKPFIFSSMEGASRKRICLGFSDDDERDKRLKGDLLPTIGMSRDMLAALCKGSRGQSTDGCKLKLSLPIESVSDGLHTLKNFGVMLLFMGRVLTARQLREWSKVAVGENA